MNTSHQTAAIPSAILALLALLWNAGPLQAQNQIGPNSADPIAAPLTSPAAPAPSQQRAPAAEPFVNEARTDGAIVVDTAPPARDPLRARLVELGFDSLDADGNGEVVPAEAAETAALTELLFNAIDADADGRLDQFEFDDYVERVQDRR